MMRITAFSKKEVRCFDFFDESQLRMMESLALWDK